MGEDLEYKCKQERVRKIGEKYIDIAMRDIEEDIQKVFENEKDFKEDDLKKMSMPKHKIDEDIEMKYARKDSERFHINRGGFEADLSQLIKNVESVVETCQFLLEEYRDMTRRYEYWLNRYSELEDKQKELNDKNEKKDTSLYGKHVH